MLALLGCAVMTGTGAVLNTAGVRPGETVAVTGCGGVSVVQGARIAGAGAIVAIEVAPWKLELARRLGATHVVDASRGDPKAAVAGILGGGVDYSFEALGRPETIESGIALVGKGGTAVLIGMAPRGARVPIDALTMTLEERSVVGCWYGSCRPPTDFARLIEFHSKGKLDLGSLVTATCRLDDVNDASAAMERGDVARTVIDYGA